MNGQVTTQVHHPAIDKRIGGTRRTGEVEIANVYIAVEVDGRFVTGTIEVSIVAC